MVLKHCVVDFLVYAVTRAGSSFVRLDPAHTQINTTDTINPLCCKALVAVVMPTSAHTQHVGQNFNK
jgi:hypothetical protein